MAERKDTDEELAFTVATVWLEERVSCPHPDLLRAWAAGGLEEAAVDLLDHIRVASP